MNKIEQERLENLNETFKEFNENNLDRVSEMKRSIEEMIETDNSDIYEYFISC